MNLELTDEQTFLREAARDAFSRTKTIAAARDALEDRAALPDLWPTAREAGWTGLLVGEKHGGAGLGVFDAALVMMEAGRVLAGVPLLGHLPASALADLAGAGEIVGELAEGERRGCFIPARPPGDVAAGWTVEPRSGSARVAAPTVDDAGCLFGSAAWVPDAPGADGFVVAATRADGTPAAVATAGSGEGIGVEDVMRYDAMGAPARVAPTATLGGGGLCSTAGDYVRFAEMLRGRGELDGVRILAAGTVDYMATNHLPGGADLTAFGRPLFSETTFDGVGFGLGVSVTFDPVAAKVPGSIGDHGWGGAASTSYWVDPVRDLSVVFMTQLLPSSTLPIRSKLKQLVHAAIVET